MNINIKTGAIHSGLASIIVTGIDNTSPSQEQIVDFVKHLIHHEMADERVLVTPIAGGIEIRYAANAEQIKCLEAGLRRTR